MIQNSKRVSIVIPVYNEADSLGACLTAIAQQTVKPYEVIVVDNNSTDGTLTVAQSFDFVTMLHEPKQGVVHARNRGFDVVGGDIIGRIDADTLLPPDWVIQVQAIFDDSSVSAVSGAAHYYDFALANVADSVDAYLRLRLARKLGDTNFLWGANMAVRRSAWQQVRQATCAETAIHEDFDLAIHLQLNGYQVRYEPSLAASVSSRRVDTKFISFVRYTLVSPRTYARHKLHNQRYMYSIILMCWLAYLPARLIYRAYDPASGNFSPSRLLATTASRVDPTTNII